MITFVNTTPFIALKAINRLDLLPKIFTEIHVVASVVEECRVGGPIDVPPLEQLEGVVLHKTPKSTAESAYWELDRGERDTLLAALQHKTARVVLDEKRARAVAAFIGLEVVGTLGVLVKAKRENWIHNFREDALKMMEKGIHYHPKLIDKIAFQLGEL